MSGGKGVAIVGNGGAAAECFLELRRQGFSGEIDVYAAGDLPVYNPMLTSYYAAGKIPYSMMFPYGDDFHIFEENRVTLHQNTPVAKVHAATHQLTSESGETFSFDKCLIATGASAFVPSFPGSDSKHVYTMRTVEDALRLHQRMANKPKKALVVGASMVGIKLVEHFDKSGMECCLADMAPHIFPLAANEECAHIIENRLVARGLRLRFSAAIERAEDTGSGIRAWFKDSDQPEEADLLLMCIGVQANINPVNPEEIETKQGIFVNERMETSAPGIYAAGDVAQGMNLMTGQRQVIGLWANARNQGRTAGANMAGVPREYRGDILHNITHFMGMDFVGIGEVHEYDSTLKAADECHYAQLFYKGGALCGATFLDRVVECGVLKNFLARSLSVSGCEGEAMELNNRTIQQHLMEKLHAFVLSNKIRA